MRLRVIHIVHVKKTKSIDCFTVKPENPWKRGRQFVDQVKIKGKKMHVTRGPNVA